MSFSAKISLLPPFSLVSRGRVKTAVHFRTGLRPGIRRDVRRFVLLRVDGVGSLLLSGQLSGRITVVDLPARVAGLLHRQF